MTLYEKIIAREEKIAVVGLGYVGLPIAIAFAKKVDAIGFDIDASKVKAYTEGQDCTNELESKELKHTSLKFTNDERELANAKFIIVAVPTPINQDNTPNLHPIVEASKIVGRNLTKGSIVVYESTVYPGVTEEICIPILEKESGLKCIEEFKVGYSPERINPGDKIHRLENIVKIVSGIDEESLQEIKNIYEIIISAGTHSASTIKTAEAIKVVENSQRDINIAFMNELAIVFDKMNIDTNEVVDGMNTKWNALGFRPGLVGGHCIGVDPYYFIYKAEELGYHSELILSGRKINNSISWFVADTTIKQLILAKKNVSASKTVILGLTFKENCPDIRNSKVIDIVERLREYGVEPTIVDPWADPFMVKKEYGFDLVTIEEIADADCVIIAVAHDVFKKYEWHQIDSLFKKETRKDERVLIDVKGIKNKKEAEELGYRYWRL